MITDKDVQDMVEYIERKLNQNQRLYPNHRKMYLSICFQSKNRTLTKNQKEVLVIAYNKLFNNLDRD